MRNNNVRKLALSAMMTALCVIICTFASLFSTMSMAITAVSGIVVTFVVYKCGYKYSLLVYFAVSILSALLVPNKEAVVYFIFLFGLYPILKPLNQRLVKRWLIWTAKIAEANILFFVVYIIASKLLGIDDFIERDLYIIGLILYNIAFVIYDICLDRFEIPYRNRHSKSNGFH